MSTHIVEIIEIGEIRPHPDSDRMAITSVYGWQCCIGKDQFKTGDRVVYCEPDYCVPLNREEFAFLRNEKNADKTHERIRPRRLRGELSQGLLIKVPADLDHLPTGTNVIEQLGIIRYVPPIEATTGGMFIGGPSGLYTPKFDVENYQRYGRVEFESNEEVVISEKIHGANGRFVYAKDSSGEWQQFCGTRENWVDEDDRNIWWLAFKQDPSIGAWCRANPEKLLYGEVAGRVGGYPYGAARNQVLFFAFAILDCNQWLDYPEFVASCNLHSVPTAPLLYHGPFDEKLAYEMAELDSAVTGALHHREGVVILPIKERRSNKIGRTILKIVGNRFLESEGKKKQNKREKRDQSGATTGS